MPTQYRYLDSLVASPTVWESTLAVSFDLDIGGDYYLSAVPASHVVPDLGPRVRSVTHTGSSVVQGDAGNTGLVYSTPMRSVGASTAAAAAPDGLHHPGELEHTGQLLQQRLVGGKTSADKVYSCLDLGPHKKLNCSKRAIRERIIVEKRGKADNCGDKSTDRSQPMFVILRSGVLSLTNYRHRR